MRSVTQKSPAVGGFTILEIIIVVIIIAVLISLAVPRMQTMIERSRSVEGIRALQSIRAALEQCRQFRGGIVNNIANCIGVGPDYVIYDSGLKIRDVFETINSHFNYSQFTSTCMGSVCSYCFTIYRNDNESSNDPGTSSSKDFYGLTPIFSNVKSEIALCVDDNTKIVKILGSGWYEGIGN